MILVRWESRRNLFRLEALEPRVLLAASDPAEAVIPLAESIDASQLVEEILDPQPLSDPLSHPNGTVGLPEALADIFDVDHAGTIHATDSGSGPDPVQDEPVETEGSPEEAGVADQVLDLATYPELERLALASPWMGDSEGGYDLTQEMMDTLTAAMPPPMAIPMAGLRVDLSAIPQWIEQGPGAILNGQSIIPNQSNPVVGAVQSVVAHPDGMHVFLGTVNGGVWRTKNIRALDAMGQPSPVWEPLTDSFSSLAIGDVALDPTTTATTPLNQTILWAGTGSFSSSGSFNEGGVGLLRSTDGGDTWVELGVNELKDLRVTQVMPTNSFTIGGKIVYAATMDKIDPVSNRVLKKGGVFRGVIQDNGDGTVTERWQRLSGKAGNGLPNGSVTDFVRHPTNPFQFFAAIPGQGIFQLTAGDQWQNLTGGANGIPQLATAQRVRMDIHSSPGNFVIYVGIIGQDYQMTAPTMAGVMNPTMLQLNTLAGLQVGDQLRVNSNSPNTLVSADAAAGQMQITVDDLSSVSNFNRLRIGAGAVSEFLTVASTNMMNNTVTFTTALQNSYIKGALVSGSNQIVTITAMSPGTNTVTIDANSGVAGNQGLRVPFPGGITVRRLPAQSGRLTGLFQSTDLGVTWASLMLPTSTDITGAMDNNGDGDTRDPGERTTVTNGLHPGAQGLTHFSLLADPANPNQIYMGGDVQPSIGLIFDNDNNGNGVGDFRQNSFPAMPPE